MSHRQQGIEEDHRFEQFFYDDATTERIFRFVKLYERPLLLCNPSLAAKAEEAGMEYLLLDRDPRWKKQLGKNRFKQFELSQPRQMRFQYDVVFCDPPFANVALPVRRGTAFPNLTAPHGACLLSLLNHAVSHFTRAGSTHRVPCVFRVHQPTVPRGPLPHDQALGSDSPAGGGAAVDGVHQRQGRGRLGGIRGLQPGAQATRAGLSEREAGHAGQNIPVRAQDVTREGAARVRDEISIDSRVAAGNARAAMIPAPSTQRTVVRRNVPGKMNMVGLEGFRSGY